MGEVNAQVAQEMHATTGAVVLGRRTFAVGVVLWGDTPFPVPCSMLMHEAREKRVEESGVFTFVTEGLERAVTQAQAATPTNLPVALLHAQKPKECVAPVVDVLARTTP